MIIIFGKKTSKKQQAFNIQLFNYIQLYFYIFVFNVFINHFFGVESQKKFEVCTKVRCSTSVCWHQTLTQKKYNLKTLDKQEHDFSNIHLVCISVLKTKITIITEAICNSKRLYSLILPSTVGNFKLPSSPGLFYQWV